MLHLNRGCGARFAKRGLLSGTFQPGLLPDRCSEASAALGPTSAPIRRMTLGSDRVSATVWGFVPVDSGGQDIPAIARSPDRSHYPASQIRLSRGVGSGGNET